MGSRGWHGRRFRRSHDLCRPKETLGFSFGRPSGDADFEEIIVALNDIGYAGPLSIEWEDSRMDRFHGAAELQVNSLAILISSQTKSPSIPPSTRKTSKRLAGFGTTSKQNYETRYETKVTHGNGGWRKRGFIGGVHRRAAALMEIELVAGPSPRTPRNPLCPARTSTWSRRGFTPPIRKWRKRKRPFPKTNVTLLRS